MMEKTALSKGELLKVIANLSSALGNSNHSDGHQLIVAQLYDRCREYLGVDLNKKSEAKKLLKQIKDSFNKKN